MRAYVNNKFIGNINLASNSYKRIKGLMFQKNIKEGLLIIPSNSIHTFFMRESIDVIYLNKQSVVIKITHEIKPWRIDKIVWKAHAVLELPHGIARKMDITIGQKMVFLEN